MQRSFLMGIALLGAALSGCPEQKCEADSDCPEDAYCDGVCFARRPSDAGSKPPADAGLQDPPDAGHVAPATPTGLTATPAQTQVVLTWNAGSEADLAKYNLHWGTTADALDQTASVAVPETTHTVDGLAEGTTFYFAVDAENSAGQRSSPSAVVSVVTLVTPTLPNVTATTPEDGAIGITRKPSITVVFSKSMHPAATEAAFEITSPTGFNTGTFTWNGAKTEMTFHAGTEFPYGTSVAFRVSKAARDGEGNNLPDDLSRTFRVVQLGTAMVYSTAALDGELCEVPASGYGVCFRGNVNTTLTGVSVGRDVSEYGTAVQRLALNFDLGSISPTPSAIVSANLALYQVSSWGTPFDASPAGIGPLMVESVTWGSTLEASAFNRAANTSSTTGLALAKDFPAGAGNPSVDVTALVVEDWLRTTSGKRSQMRVRFARDMSNPTSSSSYVQYSTGDHASNKPHLILSYEHP